MKSTSPKSSLFPYTTLFRSTSKLLKERYFEGITHLTVYDYWQALQSLAVAEFSFQTFMQASMTDVDIKKDFRLEPTERSEEHTSELQSRGHIVCRLLLEKKN